MCVCVQIGNRNRIINDKQITRLYYTIYILHLSYSNISGLTTLLFIGIVATIVVKIAYILGKNAQMVVTLEMSFWTNVSFCVCEWEKQNKSTFELVLVNQSNISTYHNYVHQIHLYNQSCHHIKLITYPHKFDYTQIHVRHNLDVFDGMKNQIMVNFNQ